MLIKLNTRYPLEAIDAGHFEVGTYGLVHLDVLPHTLSFALFVSFALYQRILALSLVNLSILIVQDFVTAQFLIIAVKSYVFNFLLHLLLNRNKSRILAQHGTLSSFSTKFAQASLMEKFFAFFALHCIS